MTQACSQGVKGQPPPLSAPFPNLENQFPKWFTSLQRISTVDAPHLQCQYPPPPYRRSEAKQLHYSKHLTSKCIFPLEVKSASAQKTALIAKVSAPVKLAGEENLIRGVRVLVSP